MAKYELIRNATTPQSGMGAAVLLDVSGSMDKIDNPLAGRRRIERLAEVLAGVLAKTRVGKLLTFSWEVREIPVTDVVRLPEPDGGTDLTAALEYVLEGEFSPDMLVLISDGEPNDPVTARLAMADLQRANPCVVHCRYCGPDSDRTAIQFMASLARLGQAGSSSETVDLEQPQLVAAAVAGLLTHAKR